MPTKPQKKLPKTIRVTVTMESTSEEGFAWALKQGFTFAKERWIGVTVSHKDDPTTMASCRTTHPRKRREATG